MRTDLDLPAPRPLIRDTLDFTLWGWDGYGESQKQPERRFGGWKASKCLGVCGLVQGPPTMCGTGRRVVGSELDGQGDLTSWSLQNTERFRVAEATGQSPDGLVLPGTRGPSEGLGRPSLEHGTRHRSAGEQKLKQF